MSTHASIPRSSSYDNLRRIVKRFLLVLAGSTAVWTVSVLVLFESVGTASVFDPVLAALLVVAFAPLFLPGALLYSLAAERLSWPGHYLARGAAVSVALLVALVAGSEALGAASPIHGLWFWDFGTTDTVVMSVPPALAAALVVSAQAYRRDDQRDLLGAVRSRAPAWGLSENDRGLRQTLGRFAAILVGSVLVTSLLFLTLELLTTRPRSLSGLRSEFGTFISNTYSFAWLFYPGSVLLLVLDECFVLPDSRLSAGLWAGVGVMAGLAAGALLAGAIESFVPLPTAFSALTTSEAIAFSAIPGLAASGVAMYRSR